MNENPPPPVRLKSPERPLVCFPLLGLQGRLAIGGDALFPSTHVELTKDTIVPSEQKMTLQLMEEASIRERIEATRGITVDMWKESAVAKMVAVSSSSLGKDHTGFFVKMGIDTEHFTDKDAQAFYNTYFSKEQRGKSIEVFRTNVINAYTTDGTIDSKALKNDLVAIQWMAGMLGKKMGEMAIQQIHGLVDEGDNQETFIEERKDKVNNLSKHEKELLTFLTEGKKAPARLEKEIKILDPQEALEVIQVIIPPETGPGESVNSLTLEQKNKLASRRYIDTLDQMFEEAKKDPRNRYSEVGADPNGAFIRSPIGIKREERPGSLTNHYYEFNSVLMTAWERYKLPLITLTLGGHANLVLNIRQNPTDKSWRIVVYDPMKKGDSQIENKDFNLRTSAPIKIVEIPNDPDILNDITVSDYDEKSEIWRLLTLSRRGEAGRLFIPTPAWDGDEPREAWHDFVANGKYDLTLQGDQDFTDEAILAKTQAFQTEDGYNCIAYSLWAALIRTAAKYSPDNCPEVYKEFFAKGLPQFEQDFGFPIATRKELQENDFITK